MEYWNIGILDSAKINALKSKKPFAENIILMSSALHTHCTRIPRFHYFLNVAAKTDLRSDITAWTTMPLLAMFK